MDSYLRPRALGALACVAFLAWPLDVEAFCRTTTAPLPPSYSPTSGCFTRGIVLYWKNACIGYSVHQDAAPGIPYDVAVRIVDSAFSTWESVECPGGGKVGISAENLGAVECSSVRYNQNAGNQNLIVFRSDAWPYNDSNNTLGLTTVTFNADTGEIYDADMEINAAQRNLTTTDPVPQNGFDLQSVVTHEVGHFLGLAHATAPTSTMYAAYKPGTSSLRALAADDIEGICTIYPSTAERLAQTGLVPAGPCDPTPRRGFSATCEGGQSSANADGTSEGCQVGARGPMTGTATSVLSWVVVATVTRLRRRTRHTLP